MKQDVPDSFAENHAKRDETRLNHSDGADLVGCESDDFDRPDFDIFSSDRARLAVTEQTLSFRRFSPSARPDSSDPDSRETAQWAC